MQEVRGVEPSRPRSGFYMMETITGGPVSKPWFFAESPEQQCRLVKGEL